MKILYAASEAVPFAATGGLGDVMGSLPAAVKRRLGEDSDIRAVIPLYPSVRERFGDDLTLIWEGECDLAWRRQYMGIHSYVMDGVTYYFIDNEHYFKRTGFYGDFDDGERFAFFSAAILRLLKITEFYPNVIHANDWQTALVPVYLRLWYGGRPEYDGIRTVYTIHNISYQGIYSPEILWDVFGIWDRDRALLDYGGAVNLTKGGIVCADRVTTVSPTYAQEIQTEHYSHGLHHILRENSHKLSGIINGIDTQKYSPETDPNIAENYTSKDLSGKKECRLELCRLCGFENNAVPIVAMVSRLASHKGFDLIERVIREMLDAGDARFVLLGTGEKRYEDYFSYLGHLYGGSFKAFITFDPVLASKLYAGADMFLMPSESEPCGLAQMIASRYGTVPIVRETGGLSDTIKSLRDDTGEGNGFTFTSYNAHDMMYTVRRAVSVFKQKRKWNSLVRRVMAVDFTWDRSAGEYIRMYRSLIQ
ncbi:MAG: glycogen synthase [Ruminococcaceae bacterium]|nr:glycogen synthase [Oscillospiraceae bacterium]